MFKITTLPTLLAVLLTSSAAASQAGSAPRGESQPLSDRIVLKSGTVISGKILRRSPGEVVFRIAGKGEVNLPRTRIRVIQPAGQDVGIYGLKVEGTDAGDEPESYVHYSPGKRKKGVRGTLSTGVSRWHHAKTDTTLFLVGAVHIGEQAYYDRVQAILDQTDVVLFEAVRKGDEEMTPEQLASMSALSKMQIAMKDALGLEFQKDAMRYDRKFWKNADVDFVTLQKHMKQNNAALPTENPIVRGLLGIIAAFISGAKENQRAHDLLRSQLAPILARADEILATRMKKIASSIILFRNEKAMEFVKTEVEDGPKGRWLSLFYGAGHLPDLADRLRGDDWKFEGADFVTAWHFTGR